MKINSPTCFFIEPPIRPPMKEDESSIGYLLRLKSENGYGNLSRLSRKGTLSVTSLVQTNSTIEAQGWASVQKDKLSDEYNKLPKSLMSTAAQVCPKCLQEDGYWRVYWHAKYGGVCRTHKIRLINACDKCGKHISVRQKHLHKCDCGRSYNKLTSTMATELEVKLLLFIEGNHTIIVQGKSSHLDSRNTPSMSSRFRLVSRLSKMIAQNKAPQLDNVANVGSQSQYELNACAEILLGNEQFFDRFLNTLLSAGCTGLDDASLKETRRKRLTVLCDTLFEGGVATLIVRLDEYLERQNININRSRSNSFRLKKLLSGIQSPTDYLADLFSVPEQMLIENGAIKDASESDFVPKRDLFEAQNIARLYRKTLSMSQTAERLSISIENLQLLVNASTFKTVDLEKRKSVPPRLVCKEIEDFEASVPVLQKMRKGSDCIDSIVKKYGFHFQNPHLAIFIALKTAKIRGHRVRVNGKSIYCLDIYLFEKWLSLNQYCARGSDLRKVAGYLGTQQSTLLQLIRMGFIKSSFYGKERLHHITPTQVNAFNSEYILSSRLATDNDMQLDKLFYFLDDRQVKPEIDFPSTGERLYRKEDVISIIPKKQTGSETLTRAMLAYVDNEFW